MHLLSATLISFYVPFQPLISLQAHKRPSWPRAPPHNRASGLYPSLMLDLVFKDFTFLGLIVADYLPNVVLIAKGFSESVLVVLLLMWLDGRPFRLIALDGSLDQGTYILSGGATPRDGERFSLANFSLSLSSRIRC
jgi:hypothetical protein